VRAAGPPSANDQDYEPVRFDIDVDAYIPTDYVPYEQAKIDVHRRIAASREVADLALLSEELADRFGPLPVELENLILLQQARVKLGQAGAGVVTIRGERMAITPLDFSDDQQSALAEQLPQAKYEPGRSQLSLSLPAEGADRLMMIASVANVVLAVSRQTG
jgi:transcription-repair coupling factor (superfamily II helicase)